MKESKLKSVLQNIIVVLHQNHITNESWSEDRLKDIDGVFRDYPLAEGEREMWAILGTGGALYGFQPNQQKAEEVRDKCWNIGKRKPEKYRVNFRKV